MSILVMIYVHFQYSIYGFIHGFNIYLKYWKLPLMRYRTDVISPLECEGRAIKYNWYEMFY